MVVANLLLDPVDVYVLPHTAVQYTVSQLKQGHLSTIDVRGSQYYLQVENNEVAELNDDSISITALSLGTTQVILKDKNVASSELVKQPTATVHVVDPSYLTISIAPHYNPALVRGRHYAFIVNVYDKHNNKIFLADNIVIETTISPDYFTVEYVSKNGSYVYGVPIKTGKTEVQATLSAVEVGSSILEITPPLKTSEDLEIFDPLSVIPPRTVLPWDPVTKPMYSVNLTAVGGSGSLSWSSSNGDIVGVSQTGVCKTKAQGSVTVTAVMMLNTHNKDSAEIHIVEALGLSLLEGVVEVEVDTPLPLHVASFTQWDNTQVPFTVCHQLPFKVEPSEVSFAALPDVKTPSVNNSCAVVEVVGKTPGFSKVKVSYESSKGELAASADVAAFRPLRPTNPASGETVLALGSSRVVVFQGGPLPWIGKPTSHFAQVEIDDAEKVEVKLLEGLKKQADLHAVRVHCHSLGEFTVTLTVGNKPSPTLRHPRTVDSSLKVICALPDSISLQAVSKRPVGAQGQCPVFAEIGIALAHCYKPLQLEVIVTDSENRKFDNVSSLALKWELSDDSLASTPAEPSSLTQVTNLHGYNLPMFSYQTLEPTGQVGEVVVSVKLNGYNKFVSQTSRQHPVPSLSASLPVKLVQDAVLNPSHAVLYQHKDNMLELSLSGGSGFFELQAPENEIVSLVYLENEMKVNVRPLSDGDVTVSLIDVCLEAETPVSSTIKVASIVSLDLVMVDRVELGGTLEAEVIARDASGNSLPAHFLMDLTLNPQANIITTKYLGTNNNDNAIYEVVGRHVGDTTLRASAGNGPMGDSVIHSQSKPVQVFPPLTLQPKNITLIIGANYQVETKGGPYPDATVVYSMLNETIANTSHTGVITALSLGTTILTAQAISINKDNGGTVVYSQDTVIVNVVPLTSIHIHAPLTHLETGTTMPLYAIGNEEDQNPLAYATALPPLLFEWTVSNKQVATFNGIFKENGIIESKENNGIVQLSAEQAGRVTVTLKVKPVIPSSFPNFQLTDNALLTDKLEVKVFESLKLKHPDDGSSNLLLSPEAETKIKTNRDGNGKLSYAVEGCKRDSAKAADVITVSPNGVVNSGSTTGQATVIVTVEENFGVTQSISILVEVKKMTYLQAGVEVFMSTLPGESLSVVPVGVTMMLHLTYHDNRGRIFHATNAHPTFRPSRFDLVDVKRGGTNNTLQVTVRGTGQTVLHIWNENDALVSGFLRINTGPGIFPHKTVIPLGGHICLSSSIRSPDGEADSPREWSSAGDILQLDTDSGIAFGQQIGRSVVSYKVSSSLTAATEISVTPITKISLSIPTQAITTGEESEPYLAMVTLGGEGSASGESQCKPAEGLLVSPPFTCIVAFSPPIPQVDAKEVLKASAVYMAKRGYACEISSVSSPSSLLAKGQASVILEAVVVSRGQQSEVRSGQVTIPFYPAPFAEISEVTLTNEVPSTSIEIQGTFEVLSTLEITSDVSQLDLSLGTAESNKRPLVLSLRDSVWSEVPEEPLTVAISSPYTRSKIEVSVKVEQVGDGYCASPRDLGIINLLVTFLTTYDRLLISIACLVLTIACIVISYHALFGPGYKQTQQTGVFANSPMPGPAMTAFSPNRPSPSGSGSSGASGGMDSLAKRLDYSPSPQRITLWSVNNEPIYGAPPFRRGAYEDSPTYRSSPK
ncbi:nuclear pore membrane glycoprotein 210-like [Penaeus indicus]|uniref:nuclear pore membrane glycoprotein 210-like n=1 Tax=Penaeus indicus TaxID=29960 RepID=UPI00300D78F4